MCSSSNESDESIEVTNPATAEGPATVPVGNANDVEQAVASAARAFPEWHRTPANDRVQYLLALVVTTENDTDKVLHEWDGDSENEWFGWIARNIGDVDSDGVNDVTTSGPVRDGFAGDVCVYSGKTGKRLWSVSGGSGDQLGMGIEAAGDTNADGIPDVVVGAPGAGKSYVYSGKDGSVLLGLEAAHENENFGGKVSDVGYVDGDG